MGFDKHFYEDHCYLDDPADGVGMNVEIIENTQHTVTDQKPIIRYLVNSGSSNSNINDSYEDANRCSKKIRNAFVYLPFSEFCTDHKDMFLHEDEKLVKPGDKFGSHDDFVKYLNENAKRWCFYYKCSDSRKPNTKYETYTYNCVYLRNKEKYKKKGLRKRNNSMKTDCPCKIKLRHLPNEKELTVIHVCNHHDHELSLEEFYKLQHGRRLPPHIKEEILDFLTLKVDVMKIRAYVEMETGFKMSRPFFYALEKNMKSQNVERQITEERLMKLKDKIAAVDEMFHFNSDENADEHVQDNQEHTDEAEPSKPKQRRSMKNTDRTSKIASLKRRSKANDEVTISNDFKRTKIEEQSENSETYQSVKNLQESVKCEIQRNPWVSDQCVPVLPDRTAIEPDCEESVSVQTVQHLRDTDSNVQNEMESFSYTIEYYNPDDNSTHEIICNEFGEIINDGQANENDKNDIDNIVYETVVTDDIEETQYEGHEYVNDGQIPHESIEIHINSQVIAGDQNKYVENTQDMVQVENRVEYIPEEDTENVEYINEINEVNNTQNVECVSVTNEINNSQDVVQYVNEINEVSNAQDVEYVNEINEVNNAQDVGVQTAKNASSAHLLVPVFDVYMKDGNVTGFVVNNNMISGLKDGVDKEIQTSEESIFSETQALENADEDEIIYDITNNDGTYTKHEYVHKYNIDKYMVQPHFPKYVETLAKETSMDVLGMFTNIYNEKAMFKITTTQKGKEGNTKIWYVTDVFRSKRQRRDEAYREKMGRNLENIVILKEKVRKLKKLNSELASSNKQLEDVALRLVNLT